MRSCGSLARYETFVSTAFGVRLYQPFRDHQRQLAGLGPVTESPDRTEWDPSWHESRSVSVMSAWETAVPNQAGSLSSPSAVFASLAAVLVLRCMGRGQVICRIHIEEPIRF